MENIIVKIGGSLLISKHGKFNLDLIQDFSRILTRKYKYQVLTVVCGGGMIARDYINAMRYFNANESLCDLFGIEISRLNARLIITALGNHAYPVVPKTISELARALLHEKIIVMGGLQPGQSTTSVALEVAEFCDVNKLIILTDVPGIYTSDPKKDPSAKLIENLNYKQLEEIILKNTDNKQANAGEYRIFDAVSLQILKRSHINIIITSGKDLSEFEKFLKGESKIRGTFINQ